MVGEVKKRPYGQGESMSVSAVSSSSSAYWEEMLNRTKESSSTQQNDLASQLFGDLDSDGNGALSLEESGLDQDLYSSIDTDGDGSISQTELQQAIELQQTAMFTNMQLSEQNLSTAQSKNVEQTTASEQPSAQEMLSAIMSGQTPPPPPAASESQTAAESNSDDMFASFFSELDSDGSDSISVAESGLNQSVFDSMDTDQDGTVSSDELFAALEKQRQTLGGFTDSSSSLTSASLAQGFLTALANNAYQTASQTAGAAATQSVEITA